MNRLRLAAVVSVWILSVVPLLGAETPLDAIPKAAGVVVRLKAPDATVGKVADFVGQVDEGTGQMVRSLQPALGMLIDNPTLAGVDSKRDWWLAVVPFAARPPEVLFLIPATDAEAMRGALGEKWTFLKHGDWGVYTTDAEIASAARAQLKMKRPSVVLDKASQSVFDAGDLSFFINAPQLREIYKDQLAVVDDRLHDLSETLSQQAPPSAGVDLASIIKAYEAMLHGLLQGVRDTGGLTIAIGVTKEAAVIEDYWTVADGSPSDKLLQKNPPSDLKLLGRLPAGKLGYLGLHIDMPAFMQWSAAFSNAVYQSQPKVKQRFDEIMEKLSDLKYGSTAMAFSLADADDGVVRAYTLQEVEPVDKAREVTRQSATLPADLKVEGLETTVELKPDAEKYGTHSGDVLRLHQQFDPSADSSGMVQRFYDLAFGKDGMTQRTVYLKGMMVSTLGNGRETMEELLKTTQQTGGTENAPLTAARKTLTDKANVIGLIDLPRLSADLLRLAAGQPGFPLPLDAAALDKLDLKPSYLGFALTTEPHALRAKTYLPVEQIQGIANLVRAVQQQMNTAAQRQFEQEVRPDQALPR